MEMLPSIEKGAGFYT